MIIIYAYFIAAAYSLILNEIFNIHVHDTWNWGPSAGIIGAAIALTWLDKNTKGEQYNED